MRELSEEGRRIVADVAHRHGVSEDAVRALLLAVAAGGGTQAQFSIPELGGMGQWSRGGMVMVGDMFNDALKARVNALCLELADHLPAAPFAQQSQGARDVSLFAAGSGSGNWWPADLGHASSTGAQNALRYAVFPGSRRLAIAEGDRVAVYDTGDHLIGGVSQQQSGDRTLTFTSQFGTVHLGDLRKIEAGKPEASIAEKVRETAVEPSPEPSATETPAAAPATAVAAPPVAGSDDPIAMIERLAHLRDRKILSDEEFQAKKAELLARL